MPLETTTLLARDLFLSSLQARLQESLESMDGHGVPRRKRQRTLVGVQCRDRMVILTEGGVWDLVV